MNETCLNCLYFKNDPSWLEKELPGLNALSSAYGASRGENGICTKKNIYLSPVKKCKDYKSYVTD